MPKTIECDSEIGVTIGLIDTLINTARVLRPRLDLETIGNLHLGLDGVGYGKARDQFQPVRDALTDLCSCKELREIITIHDDGAMAVIHDAAALLRAVKK